MMKNKESKIIKFPSNLSKNERLVEAILFSAEEPLDIESIKENMYLYTPLHFIVPFLAHAIGTLVGAIIVLFVAVPPNVFIHWDRSVLFNRRNYDGCFTTFTNVV